LSSGVRASPTIRYLAAGICDEIGKYRQRVDLGARFRHALLNRLRKLLRLHREARRDQPFGCASGEKVD
jgi:hypothetical protein